MMAISTILALTGNIQIALPGHTRSPFAWLEAVAPPLIVLSTAYVLKEQALESIEQRHADERAFREALAEWQTDTASPEDHPQWVQFYANALRDALWKANNRRQEKLSQMTQDDWRVAVTREMDADLWYEHHEQDEALPLIQVSGINTLTASRNGNTQKRLSPPSETLRRVWRRITRNITIGRAAASLLFECLSATRQART